MIEENDKCRQLRDVHKNQLQGLEKATQKLKHATVLVEKTRLEIAEINNKISALRSDAISDKADKGNNDPVANGANAVSEAVHSANEIAELEAQLSSLTMILASAEGEIADLEQEISAMEQNIKNIAQELVSFGCHPI